MSAEKGYPVTEFHMCDAAYTGKTKEVFLSKPSLKRNRVVFVRVFSYVNVLLM